jgi:hypothetical protein
MISLATRRLVICACLLFAGGAWYLHAHKPAPAPEAAPETAAAPAPTEIDQTPAPQPAPVAPEPQVAVSAPVPAPAPPLAPPAPAKDNRNSALIERIQLMARLRDWAASDPFGALEWVLKTPDSPDFNDELQAVCLGLGQTDPAHAVEMAQTLEQPPGVVENLVQQWAASDLTSALQWANDQPEGGVHDELITRVALVLSKTDPSDAAGLVTEQIPPGTGQDEAVMMVVHQWGDQDLQAAASWVQTFPESPLRDRATEELQGLAQYKADLAHQ